MTLKDFNFIEIELSSYCNRTCWFCPNSFIDRHSEKKFMSVGMYRRLLDELAGVHFAGMVSFSRYNEPFASASFKNGIAIARMILPKATLHTNTNGDYLTAAKLREAADAGLNSVYIQIYTDTWNKATIQEVFERIRDKCELQNVTQRRNSTQWVEWRALFGGLHIRLYARDFRANGCDRGGSLALRSLPRDHGCTIPHRNLYVDWTGDVMPCCNLRGDIPDHQPYVYGNLESATLAEIVESEKAQAFRRDVLFVGTLPKPCKTCQF